MNYAGASDGLIRPFISFQRMKLLINKMTLWVVRVGRGCTLERHNFGLFGLDFLHGNVHVLVVCTHVVGQPGKCH